MFRKFCVIAAAAGLTFAAAAATTGGAAFDPDRYLRHIRFLASPEMKGRATGSPELEKAAAYIVEQFRAEGLQPPPGSSGYLQSFQVTTSARLGSANRFEFSSGGETQMLEVKKQ